MGTFPESQLRSCGTISSRYLRASFVKEPPRYRQVALET